MSERVPQIHLDGATRLTLDVSGAPLFVTWREDIEDIIISSPDVNVDRAGDEIFIRIERQGRRRPSGLFGMLPNISAPGVKIDWSGEESSIEVSDEDGVIVRTGLGAAERTPDSSSISVDVPTAIAVTTIEVESGDLVLATPRGKVESNVKTGNMRSTGGDVELSASLGSGDARIRDLTGSLNVMAGSGEIHISEIEARTSVKAGSGEVSLSQVKGESIDLMAGSGDVLVQDCYASALSCQTGSGEIDITGGEIDEITVRSGSGDVTCSAVFGAHSQSFTAGSGSVALGVPRGLPARFEVATQGGDIESDIQLVSVGQRGPRTRRTRRQVGSIGSGEPRAEVSVRTTSGDVSLYWLRSNAAPTQESIPMPGPVPASPQPPRPPEESLDPAGSTSEWPDETGTDEKDDREAVLEALARGDISVDEADALLRTLESN